MSEHATTDDASHTEEWFLEQLNRQPIPWRELLDSAQALADRGGWAQADDRARVLQTELQQRGETAAALAVLSWRAAALPNTPEKRAAVAGETLLLLGDTPEARILVEAAQLDRLAPTDGLRRLELLRRLLPGVKCHEKTWGFGIVRGVDYFGKRVEIDFDRKPGHRLSLAYAAETLRLLPDEHLLSRWHDEPDTIRTLLRERPAEIVRLALAGFGPLTATQLHDEMVPRLLPEAEWKSFWDAARKAMKKDPHFTLPAKRADPLGWQADTDAFGPAWQAGLAVERDLKAILARVDDLLAAAPERAADPAVRPVLAERLVFLLHAAAGRQPELCLRALLLIPRLGLDPDPIPVTDRLRDLLPADIFSALCRKLPARLAPEGFALFADRLGSEFASLLLERLPRFEYAAFSAAVELLRARNFEMEVAAWFHRQLAERRAAVEPLLWVLRNPAVMAPWQLGDPGTLAPTLLTCAEKDYTGERLKAQNQLKERLGKPEFLDAALQAMNENQRREFMARLKNTPAWPTLDRQAVIGLLIRRLPAAADYLATSAAPAAAAPERRKLTSRRMHRRRQRQLEKLVNTEIPQNSRDIAHARGYGDLRENFEYKAAKDMQAVLMRRQEELQQMLREVQPTDFAGLPADRAGQGTTVTLSRADGRTERYHILGVWDRDDALNIISCDTKLAAALEGRRPGTDVILPGEHGEETCRLLSVEPLPDDVRAWAAVETDAEPTP